MNRSEILENIRNQIGTENLFGGNSFRRGRCSVDLSGISENDRIVADLDKIFPAGRVGKNQCECVLFYFDAVGNFVVVPIELKGGGNVDASQAVEQLKSGAAFAINHTPKNVKTICRPVLFHNGISRSGIRQLNKSQSRVRFQGKLFEIRTTRCGGKLRDVLT